jgi:FkbM family methyltransferase
LTRHEINFNTYTSKVKGEISREDYWSQVRELLIQINEFSELQKFFDNKIIIQDNKIVLESRTTKKYPSAIKMRIIPNDIRSAPFSIVANGYYEPFQADLLLELAGESKHFIDVGANMGFYSLAMCAENKSLIVDSFEPQPNVYNILHENVLLNKFSTRITTHNLGLGSSKGELIMFVPKFTGSAGASFRNLHQKEGASTQIVVPVNLLDDFGKTSVDLIKLDVEGSELNVIKGAEKLVNLTKPTMVAELLRKWMRPFGHSPQMFLEKMFSYGYECLAIGTDSLKPIALIDDLTVETNFIFVHSEKKSHKKILEKYVN